MSIDACLFFLVPTCIILLEVIILSSFKDRFEDYEITKRILFEIGAIACCDAHDDYWYDTGKYSGDELYARATSLYKKKFPNHSNGAMKEFHADVKSVMNDAGLSSTCPYCEKAYNE